MIHNAAYFPLTPFAAIDAAPLQRTLSAESDGAFFLAHSGAAVDRAAPRRSPLRDLVGDRPRAVSGLGGITPLQGRGKRLYQRRRWSWRYGEHSRQRAEPG